MPASDLIRIIPHHTADGAGRPSRYFYWDDVAGRRLQIDAMDQDQAREAAKAFARSPKPMPDIEVYTERYEREHGKKPFGRRFWCFTLVSSKATIADHFLNLDDSPRTYEAALERAKEVAEMRKAVRIIVEP